MTNTTVKNTNSTDNTWTAACVAERFEEAVRTLRKLDIPHLRPMGYFSTWPDMVYSMYEVFCQEAQPMKVRSTPKQITQMEQTLDWLWLLEFPTSRKLIMLRATKVPWKLVCGEVGYERAHANRLLKDALSNLAKKLNKEGIEKC